MITDDDIQLTRALERGELPAGGFHHADHLRVAWVYLEEAATVDAALERMAATLKQFTASIGKSDKYSGALTAFWMYQLAAARAMMPDASIDDVLRAYSHLRDKDLARRVST
jgi:hypothetical protein